ncbi:hypothetical protein PF011_g24250 [Phytophthora fragariae]|uniref:Uncharacterized protein n=1 Tax=Phytophthora fragariae TaxID=53985 RepID=A0A6A3I6Y1_9STRA|nr:hypothetical protein PF011_g24250 [Phytophthora fragariae]
MERLREQISTPLTSAPHPVRKLRRLHPRTQYSRACLQGEVAVLCKAHSELAKLRVLALACTAVPSLPPQRVVLQALKQQVLYYKESEQAIRHLKKCAPFQELRHQFAFVYPFSDVLPLYNQKIYAKDTAKKRVKTDPTHASVKVKLKVKPKLKPKLKRGRRPRYRLRRWK